MIPLYKPLYLETELLYLQKLMANNKFSGDGEFSEKCTTWIEENLSCPHAMLTTSCTHALEIAAILLDIKEGDEIILPSYTYVSTANAFILRGARLIFIDIRPDTMNIDETLIEKAITPKTKAIVVIHYAGIACEMDEIMRISKEYNVIVVEDAAHAIMSTYKNKFLGTIGHLGCFSFHESKNIQCGEGGALLINDLSFKERAEIIRDKGTNRKKLMAGLIDKYSWIDIGSSYSLSELNAAFLYPQLLQSHVVQEDRLRVWYTYYKSLKNLAEKNFLILPSIPAHTSMNGHIFYIKVRNKAVRNQLIQHLKNHNILAAFHYIPLHSSPCGKKFGEFNGQDKYTTSGSEKLLRLPIYHKMKDAEIMKVVSCIEDFYLEEAHYDNN